MRSVNNDRDIFPDGFSDKIKATKCELNDTNTLEQVLGAGKRRSNSCGGHEERGSINKRSVFKNSAKCYYEKHAK